MKEYFHFTKRIFFTFFILGILVSLLDIAIQLYWMDFIRVIWGESIVSLVYYSLLSKCIEFMSYSPWLILVVILGKDILKKNFSRTISFFAGISVVCFTSLWYNILNFTGG